MADEKKGFSAEEQAELKTALGEIESKLGTKVADQTKAAIDKAMEPLNNKLSDLEKYKVSAEEAQVKNQDALDKLIAENKLIKTSGSDEKSLKAQMAKAFEEKKDLLAKYKDSRTPISFELKTVGDIGANSNISVSGTPAFVPGPALWEPGRKPYEVRHIRDLMRVVAQGQGTDAYVIRDAGGEGGPTTVGVGGAKPQSDRDWVKTQIPITKVAHYYKVPEEYLADIVWMQDEITGVGIEELLAKEDSLILTNSAGGEFLGLNQSLNSTAFSCPTALVNLFTGSITANNYDVLVAAWTQLRNLKSSTTGVLLHPSDYAAMILTKDTTGQYPFGAPNQSIPNLFGAPIVPHTAVTSDKFFLGDFTKVKVGVRAGLSVRFYDQNEDDAIYNMVTVVIEERITMAADRADRIIYGDFSDARADLQST